MTSSVPPSGSGPNQPAGPQGSTPAQPTTPTSPASPASSGGPQPGQVQGKPMTFLGMTFDAKQAQQLNNIMIQNIGNEIQKYNDKGVQAIKNYQKVSEGEDPD